MYDVLFVMECIDDSRFVLLNHVLHRFLTRRCFLHVVHYSK